MKQHITIGELAKLPNIRVMHYTLDGPRTPRSLHEHGMWACNTCGAVHDLCLQSCPACGDERFILVEEDYQPLTEDIPFKINQNAL